MPPLEVAEDYTEEELLQPEKFEAMLAEEIAEQGALAPEPELETHPGAPDHVIYVNRSKINSRGYLNSEDL